MALASGGRASEFLGHPNGPRTSSKHIKTLIKDGPFPYKMLAWPLPDTTVLGCFFSTFRCIKRLWYPKIEGVSPRNPLRTTSRAKEPEEDLTEDKSPDQEPPEAWGRPSCGAIFFLNMSDLHPIHSKIDGEKDHKPWDFGVTWFLDSRQSPKKNQRARAPLSRQSFQQPNNTLLRTTLTWSFHC